MKRKICLLLAAAAITSPAYSQAKNVILIGDGAGISSLNAASIYGYGKPQALYIQKMPHLALADTSTAREWVTDGAACASAWATGHKTRNGVVSMSADAERDVRDGTIYKTVMEYAMEHGLATGVVSNEDKAGLTDAVVSAFYAHHNNRSRSADIFQQALQPKFGTGLDLMIGTGRRWITGEAAKGGHDVAADVRSKGYRYLDSLTAVAETTKETRVIALLDDEQFDFTTAVQEAVARLPRNPNGFLLVAHSDCHTGKTRTSLQRIIDLDKALAAVAEPLKNNTLILFTADHSYDLRIKGESLTETSKESDHKKIVSVVSLEDEHTAEEVPFLGMGPGSERIGGFMANTDVFRVMMANFGWGEETARR
jgi:alkaline phosphatase